MTDYEDIIHLPHHVSSRHAQMPVSDRAAQFAPFAALTGHGDVLREVRRTTDRRIEPDEYEQAALNEQLTKYVRLGENGPEIEIVYFREDRKKDGGEYITAVGRIRHLELAPDRIILANGLVIPTADILELHEL